MPLKQAFPACLMIGEGSANDNVMAFGNARSENTRGAAASSRNASRRRLLGGDVAGRFGTRLDPLLDVSERLQAGFNGLLGNVLQHIGGDGIAQTIEIVDELTAARGEVQFVGAAILRIVPSLQQTVLDQPIEQPHQRDRLQLQNVSEVDLRQSLLLPQSKQYNPLGARGAAALGTVVDVIAQQARTFDKLRDQLAFKIERHWPQRSPKLSNCLEFSSYSVFTH